MLIRTLVMTQTSFLVLASLIWASVDITPFRQFALSFPWCHPQVAVFPRRGYGVLTHFTALVAISCVVLWTWAQLSMAMTMVMESENAEVFPGSSRVGAMIGRQE